MKRREIAAPEGTAHNDGDPGTGQRPASGTRTNSAHKWKFLPVLDSRNRRIPHLETRNGKFIAQLWAEKDNGQRTARRFALLTPEGAPVRNIPEAKDALERLRQGRREDTLPTMGRKPTVATFAATYLASGAFLAKKPGTRQNEEQALKRWVAHCGGVRVDKLAASHAAAFIDRRLKGEGQTGRASQPAGERTVNLDLGALRNLLNAALDAGHLRTVPRLPKLDTPPPRKKAALPPSEIERLIEAAPAACLKNGVQLRDYLRLLCYCGGREAETLRLRWDDVNFTGGVLTIGADGDTKNRRARTVEFNPALEAHLRDMHARRAPDSEWLFPSPRRGEADRPAKSFRESLRLARAAARLPGFGFHDCRRFFATMAIQSGVDIQTVARWLGHQDGGVLVAKTYADVLADHRKKMAAGLSFGPLPLRNPQSEATRDEFR